MRSKDQIQSGRVGKAGFENDPIEVSESVTTSIQYVPIDCLATDMRLSEKCYRSSNDGEHTHGIADMVLLYFTHIADNVVPSGFLSEFIAETAMRRSAERSLKLATSLSDAEAEMLLSIDRKRKIQDSISSSSTTDLHLAAADLKPRRLRCK